MSRRRPPEPRNVVDLAAVRAEREAATPEDAGRLAARAGTAALRGWLSRAQVAELNDWLDARGVPRS